MTFGEPVPDPQLRDGIPMPAHIRNYRNQAFRPKSQPGTVRDN